MTRRRLLFVLLLVVALLPTAAMYVAVTSEATLRWAAANVTRIGPATLSIQGVSGSLAAGFAADVVEVDHARVNLRFEGVGGRVALLPLLWQRVRATQLTVGSAVVTVKRARPGGRPWQPRFLPRVLGIELPDVRVARGALVLPSGRREELTGITAAGRVLPQRIDIHSASGLRDIVRLTADGHLHARSPLGLDGRVAVEFQLPNQPRWLVTGHFDGDLERLPLRGTVSEPFNAPFHGEVLDLARGWHFEGTGSVLDFDLTRFGGGAALGLVKGELALHVDGSGFTARGALEPTGLGSGPLDVDFAGRYAMQRLTIERLALAHAGAGAQVTASGSIEVGGGEEPRLDLAGDWSRFRWPLPDAAASARSSAGRFSLRGIRPYALELQGNVEPAGLASLPATLRGALGTQVLRIDALRLAALEGAAELAGEVRWKPDQRWYLAGRARRFNPAALRPDLPGRLDFAVTASGGPFGRDGRLDLRIDGLTGELRGQPARGGGRLQQQRDDWRFTGVDLRVGRTRLQLDGELGARRDLRFALDAEDLGLLAHDARGQVVARGRLAGDRDAPVLQFKARGSGFEYGGRRIDALDADVDIDLRRGGRTQGALQLRGLAWGGRTLESADVVLGGTQQAHRIAATLGADPLALGFTAEGAFDAGRWSGAVTQLTVADRTKFRLALSQPAPLTVHGRDLQLGKLCLAGQTESLCLAGQSVAGNWQATLDAANIPLRALTAGLTQDTTYDGTIGVEAAFAGAAGQPPAGEVHARLTDALLRHRRPSGREDTLTLGTGVVDATATRDDFTVNVGLDAGSAGRIRGSLEARRVTSDWRDHPLRGSLDLETTSLSLLDVYYAEIDRAEGRLATKMTFGGTLGAPRFSGDLQVRDALFDFYQVNLALREVRLDARFSEDALELDGETRVGDGRGKVAGRVSWRDGQPFGRLRLTGDNLRVVNVPEVSIQASPRLDFQLAGRRIEVAGEVLLPQARLEPAEITNAVLSSGDEVIVGRPAPDPEKQFQVVSDVTMTLGDKVTIDTFGLTGRLTGSLKVRSDERDATRGTGELAVAEGRYRAFGRNLDIARGRLIFNNGPLADPGVDLRAQKVYPDITAGVNVRGTLRAQRMTFFSEPKVPQSQIVSLILAGGSFDGLSQGGNRGGGARNDLLAQGGAILAQQLGLGSRVGIDDVSIETDPTNDTSLVLGRYLAPRLYVSYGISLAEAINTLKLRYTIGDRWTLRTEAGRFRSADIVYTIQK